MLTANLGAVGACSQYQSILLNPAIPSAMRAKTMEQYKACMKKAAGTTSTVTHTAPRSTALPKSTTPWYKTTAGMLGIGAAGVGVVVAGVLLLR